MRYSGIEDLYLYGGEGGDGGGGIRLWNCWHCWVDHVEASYSGIPINIDSSFRAEVRDSYIHDSQGGLTTAAASYGISLSRYTSHSLLENNVVIHFNKVMVMRAAGGGNVVGYNYMDNGADRGGGWVENNLNSSHMTTPHYALFEGNESANFDQDDRWGNSAYITVFRNHLIGQLRDFPNSGPKRAAGVTQWHWWQSFVGNVLGNPTHPGITGYEGLGAGQRWGGQHVDDVLAERRHRARRRQVPRDAAARRQLRLRHRPGPLARHRRQRRGQRTDPASQLDAAGVDVPVVEARLLRLEPVALGGRVQRRQPTSGAAPRPRALRRWNPQCRSMNQRRPSRTRRTHHHDPTSTSDGRLGGAAPPAPAPDRLAMRPRPRADLPDREPLTLCMRLISAQCSTHVSPT